MVTLGNSSSSSNASTSQSAQAPAPSFPAPVVAIEVAEKAYQTPQGTMYAMVYRMPLLGKDTLTIMYAGKTQGTPTAYFTLKNAGSMSAISQANLDTLERLVWK